MSTNETIDSNADDPRALAGEYVLGTLSRAQRREVETRLLRDADFAALVQRLEAQLLPLTQLVAPVTPPPALWQRIERSLFAVQAAAPASSSRHTSWWNNLRVWRGLAASGFAAATILIAVLVTQPPPADVPQARFMVVMSSPQTKAPSWIIEVDANRQLRLTPLQQANVPAGRALQFWTKADGWSGPVSLGLVQAGQTTRIPLDKLPPLQPNQLFEITVEPASGSPIDRPTGPVLCIGRAVKVS